MNHFITNQNSQCGTTVAGHIGHKKNVSDDFQKHFLCLPQALRVAKRVNIWETWSRQHCCGHNVSFCRPPTFHPKPGLNKDQNLSLHLGQPALQVYLPEAILSYSSPEVSQWSKEPQRPCLPVRQVTNEIWQENLLDPEDWTWFLLSPANLNHIHVVIVVIIHHPSLPLLMTSSSSSFLSHPRQQQQHHHPSPQPWTIFTITFIINDNHWSPTLPQSSHHKIDHCYLSQILYVPMRLMIHLEHLNVLLSPLQSQHHQQQRQPL